MLSFVILSVTVKPNRFSVVMSSVTMLSVLYAECYLILESFILSVVMPSLFMLRVICAEFIYAECRNGLTFYTHGDKLQPLSHSVTSTLI